MTFESKITRESATCPGVKFTVRRLNVIQRASRDMAVADQRLRYTALLADFRYAVKDALGDVANEPNWREKLDSVPAEKQARMLEAEHKANCVYNEHIIPSSIRAGLVSIEGFDIDGKPATADSLIASGPDSLIGEIFAACEEASGMTGEEQKNLQSPGTLAGQENGSSVNGNADPAAQKVFTESMAAETAAATSPAI